MVAVMMMLIVAQVGCFVFYCMESRTISVNSPVPVHSVFIYRPDRRLELWRFVLYMLLHAGWGLSLCMSVYRLAERGYIFFFNSEKQGGEGGGGG